MKPEKNRFLLGMIDKLMSSDNDDYYKDMSDMIEKFKNK
jgi:hypothetical protein